MRRHHLQPWGTAIGRDFSRFHQEMGLFGREMRRVGRDLGRVSRRAGNRMSAYGVAGSMQRPNWGAGPWRHTVNPFPLGLGLCGLWSSRSLNRRRAINYVRLQRRRRFWRQIQIFLGVGLVALVIFLMARTDDGKNNNSNWL